MAQIVLHRSKQYFGMLRQLEIYLDGAKVGGVSYNQRMPFQVASGPHEILVKMDWCVSQPFAFMIKDSATIEFECGCNFGPLLAPLNILHRRHDFFYLRAISPLGPEPPEGVWPPPPSAGGTASA